MSGRRSGSRLNAEIFVAVTRKQERSSLKNVARRPSRFQPLSAAWQGEVPPRKPEAPAGPLTHPGAHEWPLPENGRYLKNPRCKRGAISPSAQSKGPIVLISPCGSGILHRMGQRSAVLRHGQRITSIEPPLTEWTPDKIIGIERSVLGGASSAVGHVRPSSQRRCAAALGCRVQDAGEALAPPAMPRFLPNLLAPVQADTRRVGLTRTAWRAPCASSRPRHCGRHRNNERIADCSRLYSCGDAVIIAQCS
ncbi:MAG: hypothetical protein QOI87_757 [Bradyrhizobium sp.]|nr:hypothetical protein [Bradyrhizobium sp.]